MSWLDNTPDRETTPPEHDNLCVDCEEPVEPDSPTMDRCYACSGWYLLERKKHEDRQALASIARGIDKIDAAIDQVSSMSMMRKQA